MIVQVAQSQSQKLSITSVTPPSGRYQNPPEQGVTKVWGLIPEWAKSANWKNAICQVLPR